MGTVKYTGPVASFHCPTNAEIRSLKVHFSPKQEGSGDPSPENVRPIEGWDGVSIEYTKNNITQFEPYGTGGVNLKWSVPKSILDTSSLIRYSIYIDNSNGTSEACIRAAFFDTNGNRLQSRTRASGVPVGQSKRDYFTIQPFPSGTDYVIFGIKGNNYSIKKPMIDIFKNNAFKETHYEPYQGFTTDYEFGVLGKNKLSDNLADYTLINSSADTVLSNGSYSGTVNEGQRDVGICKLNNKYPAGTYTLSFDYVNNVGNTYWRPVLISKYNDGSWYSALISTNPAADSSGHIVNTFTTNEDFYIHLTLNCFGSASITAVNSISNLQLELGSTATTYEPYDPNKTVYGGWVDLISGEVQEEGIDNDPYELITLDGTENWVLVDQNDNTTIFKFLYGISARTEKNSICSHFNIQLMSYKNLNYPNTFVHGISGNLFIQTANSLASTVEDFKTYLSEQYVNNTPVTVLFQARRANKTYNLPPHSSELKTFIGQNNVWSNADYVEVEYDLHETQAILARKQFIIANQPHIEKLAAAPLQNFVTDMVAPLKECKIHFSPVQEGSGDPSPDNVRAINGWTGVECFCSQKSVLKANTNSAWQTGYIGSTGNIAANSQYRTSDYVPMVNGELCHLEFANNSSDSAWYGIASYDSQKNFISRFSSGYKDNVDFTVSGQQAAYIRISINLASDILCYANPIITLPLDWTDSGGTVYGGYVDLVTGEVWADTRLLTIDSTTNFYIGTKQDGTNKYFYIEDLLTENRCKYTSGQFSQAQSSELFSHGVIGNSWSTATNDAYTAWVFSTSANTTIRFAVPTSEGVTTVALMQDWIAEHGALQISYPLATPTLLTTLTPTALRTLIGTNNIWSNANGNIELSYWKH